MVADGLLGITPDESMSIASFAWERKVFDPAPGPRRPRDFRGLVRAGGHNFEIGPDASLRTGTTFLPGIARESGARVFLLDPSGGTRRMATQLRELMVLTRASTAVIVDVGGDILARGDEPGLRSPLADALALAAASELERVYVVALGLGLDGELTEPEWRLACRETARDDGRWLRKKRLSPKVARAYHHYWSWHPSEATGLTCLAALGYEGNVEMRGAGLTVRLNEDSAYMHAFRYENVFGRNGIAQAVLDTESLRSAERIVRARGGQSEIDIEREVLRRRQLDVAYRHPQVDLELLEAQFLAYSDAAWERGTSYLTLRRVAEVLNTPASVFRRVRAHLHRRHSRALDPPVWSCDPDLRRARGRARPVSPMSAPAIRQR